MADLILTNGDTAADLLAAAGKAGTIMPWRDVLHDGPVAFDLAACTQMRVAHLAERYRLPAAEVAEGFAERDGLVIEHQRFERIELWFEHDLYDQLQLLQILAHFADAGRSDGLVLVQAGDFLGAQTAATILRFAADARAIDADDLDLAERVWADLTLPTPERVADFLAEPDGRLPYVEPALRRFMEELPAPGTGLGRTEAAALTAIAAGETHPGRLFGKVLASEEAAWMGDASFFLMLEDLAFCPAPLVSGWTPAADVYANRDRPLALTETGLAVLAGAADNVALRNVARWWAGTRLEGASVWRYDRAAMELVPPGPAGA